MGASLFLGVDGGGSKTGFLLIDGDGRELARVQAGTSDHGQIGMDGVRHLLSEGVNAVLAAAGARASDLAFGFFGLPAFGEDEQVAPRLHALPAAVLSSDRYACANDMVCGWAGSLAGGDGVNVVAGTGSIGYGERGGRTARAGGWGTLFSDEGSGYWIAVRALTLFSRMSDGRAPRGPLYDILKAGLQISRDYDVCGLVAPGERLGGRSGVAAVYPLVGRAADAGDAQAAEIFVDAARELLQVADAVRAGLAYPADEAAPLSYSGGAFGSGERLKSAFAAAVAAGAARYSLRAPLLSPLGGAALLAARLAGSPLSQSAIARLRESASP